MSRKKMEKGQLLKDWFGRRAEDSYTHRDSTNKLFNWDKHRKSLSSYFISEDSAVSEAARVTGSMFRVMGIDKHIRYANSHEKSNINKIKLPLGLLKTEEVTNEDGSITPAGWIEELDYEKLDAFYGKSLQEAAKFALQSREEHDGMVRNLNKKNHTVKSVLAEILNTERLDKKMASRFPGYLKFVQKFKDYTYDKHYEELPEDADDKMRLMDTIFKMLRYPAHIDEETYEEFKEPLNKIERLLKKFGGIPETKKECDSMATSLSNIIYKYIPEEEEEPPSGGGEGEDEGKDGGEGGSPSAGPSKGEMDEAASEMMEKMFGKEESENFSSDDVEDFGSEMASHDSGAGKEAPDGPSRYHNYDKDTTEGISPNRGITFTKADANKRRYEAVRDTIDFTKAQVLRKLFERKSKSYDFSMKGMRSGRLDGNKIAEAVQGVQTVYERIGHVETSKVCVGVLIDESGSMGGTRIQKAREAAIFINEAFKRMHDVELYMYGHTADQEGSDTVQIMVYKEPGFQEDPHALGSVNARSNNRDGEAILAVARRMRNITENQGILFVLSDGQPAACGYGGKPGIIDTRKRVTQAQALGFQVIQIAIEECVPSKEMFDYYVKMTNISTLPRDLSQYMSTKVSKLIKETVTV
jgi:hypothetical protein